MTDPAFDPAQTVLLHLDPRRPDPPPMPARPDTSHPASRVAVLEYKPEEMLLQAEMEQPGYVVLSDTWYPGWQALLDGQPAHIERANLVFRAIYVPQGTHTLRVYFCPSSYTWGWRLSLGTLLLLVLGSFVSARQAAARPEPRLAEPPTD
jgi:hypothetical protein